MAQDSNPSHPETVCAILVGKATDPAKALSMVRSAHACPYVALYTAHADTIVGVFTLPKTQTDWIEFPKARPRFLEVEDPITIITEQVSASSPWTRGEAQPEAELTPCSKHCDRCEHYPAECRGCPATIFYLAAE